ncbi:restriction endonuclease subunit S [Cellulomonas composti]|uniref:Type I restriction modification DNA specificity domain-containing protein n=1 Tax=Cellulomonas composti TaxID=266130 RepID=A0A511JA53_9CELL|nr:restriction endonuclease subunit S [Cellulomonas composti]GEL94877.1 hypothetical protein CCO02nite_15350 [Cellulomonas composti]
MSVLGDYAEITASQVAPSRMGADPVSIFSIPGYDNARTPETMLPSKIGSGKSKVGSPCVLLSKLNPRIPRIWLLRHPDEQTYCSPEFLQIVPNGPGLDLRYLYYLMWSNVTKIQEAVTGTTGSHQRVSKEDVLRLPLAMPPLTEQRAIAATLGAIDDKIESNQRVTTMLMKLARALLDSSVSGEARRVPIGDIAEFHNRRRIPLSSKEREARVGDIPYYGATGIFGYVDEALFDEVLVLVGEDGSVVREDGGPVLQYIWGKAWINNHAHPLTGRGISDELLFLALDRSDIRPIVTGAVQAKVSMGNLKSVVVELPTGTAFRTLEQHLATLFALYRSRADETARLIRVRDTLLPELLAGRIHVPAEAVA